MCKTADKKPNAADDPNAPLLIPIKLPYLFSAYAAKEARIISAIAKIKSVTIIFQNKIKANKN